MEGSSSAPTLPTLTNEDYHIPCHGVGDTGHANRVLQGNMSKDTGTYSSRINQIVRQAAKVPGPGKYTAHVPWDKDQTAHVIHGGNRFPNGTRDYKPCNKTPEPAKYENKDFNLGVANANKDSLSNRPRVTYGKVPAGKKRSFLDQAIAHSGKVPAPGHVDVHSAQHTNNRADTHIVKILDWNRGMVKNKGKGPAPPEIGPNHYSPSWAPTEEKFACHAVPKAKAQNFLDKAVKEKLVDIRNKLPVPGPGAYNNHTMDDSKLTRGTRYLQLRGMSRSAVSGYF